MALVLGVSVGNIIDVGQHHVQVVSIGRNHQVKLQCSDGRRFVVNETSPTSIFANVAVLVGASRKRNSARLVFDAPIMVPIVRRRP